MTQNIVTQNIEKLTIDFASCDSLLNLHEQLFFNFPEYYSVESSHLLDEATVFYKNKSTGGVCIQHGDTRLPIDQTALIWLTFPGNKQIVNVTIDYFLNYKSGDTCWSSIDCYSEGEPTGLISAQLHRPIFNVSMSKFGYGFVSTNCRHYPDNYRGSILREFQWEDAENEEPWTLSLNQTKVEFPKDDQPINFKFMNFAHYYLDEKKFVYHPCLYLNEMTISLLDN